MTKFGDKTVLHVHVQVTSSFSQPLYYVIQKEVLVCIYKIHNLQLRSPDIDIMCVCAWGV